MCVQTAHSSRAEQPCLRGAWARLAGRGPVARRRAGRCPAGREPAPLWLPAAPAVTQLPCGTPAHLVPVHTWSPCTPGPRAQTSGAVSARRKL